MAWNEPGGKRRDPWQGGGEQPPDLDAMLKRMRDGFGRFGGAGGGGLLLLIVGILLAWFLLDSWKSIDESQRGVVLRFGKFDRIMGPGLNFKWPTPIEKVFVVETTRVRSSSSDQVKMLTKDENIVIVEVNVQYLVGDPYKFVFRVREPEETLRQAAESAVRGVIGSAEMDTVLSGERTALSARAKELLQATMDSYETGIIVTEFNFQNPRPPPEVKDAFDDAIRAREDKERIENEAQAYASKVLPEARGQAARLRAEAEGDRVEAENRAEGAAARFALIAEQYRAAPEVTRKRLMIETMQEVLSGAPKVMVEGGGDKVLYLPLDRIGAPAALAPLVTQADALDRSPAVQASPAPEERRGTRQTDRREREGRDR